MQVIIDDRERSSKVVPFLQSLPDVELSPCRLPAGDYLWDNRLLFERKTLNDLADSILDGRLFDQVCRLVSSPHSTVLLLEGTARDLARRKIRREAVQGALISVTVSLGIPLLRSRNSEESAWLMNQTALQVTSVNRRPLPRRFKRTRLKGKQKTQLAILQGVPGVGVEKALWLLDTFGSIERICQAGVSELQSVRGIGKHSATKIRWSVSDRLAPYGLEESLGNPKTVSQPNGGATARVCCPNR